MLWTYVSAQYFFYFYIKSEKIFQKKGVFKFVDIMAKGVKLGLMKNGEKGQKVFEIAWCSLWMIPENEYL